MPAVAIFGVRVDDVTMEEAIACVARYVGEPGPRCRQIATVNPEFIMLARRNQDFASVLAASDLNLPDGANLVRAARMLGQPLRERVAGSDLIWQIAAKGAEAGWRIFLLGAGEGIAAQAAARLRERYPRLQVTGEWAGSPDPSEDRSQVARVNDSGAEVLFVAYGAPAQDLWIARNRERLDVRVAMGVGGALDFISGHIPRAPLWIQRAGLEWLFRLTRQPWRMRRQLALVQFAWLVVRARMKHESPQT